MDFTTLIQCECDNIIIISEINIKTIQASKGKKQIFKNVITQWILEKKELKGKKYRMIFVKKCDKQ